MEAKVNDLHMETIVDGLEPIALIIRADFDAEGLHRTDQMTTSCRLASHTV
jgi:hypothetical protein